MARTVTGPERAAIASSHHDIATKLEITDPDGAWVDVSTGLDDPDWFNSASIDEDVDANCMTLSAELLRDSGTLSLSPLMEGSTLNRDSLDAYAPMLDLVRQWRVSVSVVEHGAAPSYKPMGQGLIDRIPIQDPSPVISITGRDLGASLLDCWIDTVRTYSSAGTTSMEDVIQAMLNDNLASPPTLYTPTSPVFVMNKWEQQKESLMAAINTVARLAGMVVRYKYDSADTFRLTLHAPDRAAVMEDWEVGPTEYTALPDASLDISGVRNEVAIRYFDSAGAAFATHTETDATSIARYGGPHAIPRTLEIDLGSDTQITTSARVNTLAEAILSDTANPPLQQQVVAPGLWIAQLGDYVKFPANGVHYDTDQYGGVTHIAHRFENGMLRTTISAGGQPRGRYRTWVASATAPIPTTLALIARAKTQSTTATQVVVRVAVADPLIRPGSRWAEYFGTGQGAVTVTYVAVGCTINTPASPQTLAAANITSDIDTTATVDITIDRAAFGSGTGRVTFTATRSGRAAGVDAVEVPALDSSGPSLTVTPTPGATSYSVVWSGTGTITVSIDGAAYATPSASPITVTRTTVDQVYAFKSVLDGQTITNTVVIPLTYSGATITISAPFFDAAADTVDLTWSNSGLPSGVKFNVSVWQTGGTQKSENDKTSVHQFTGITGANADGIVQVDAEKDGVIVASKRDSGAWSV